MNEGRFYKMVNGKKVYNIFFAAAMVALIILLGGCAPRAVRKRIKIKDISLAKVLVKKELVIGLEDNFPPFAFKNIYSSGLDGYDIELARAVCLNLGVKPVFKNINWAEKDVLLKTGQIDCIWNGFSFTDEREAMYTLSKPYIRTTTIFTVLEKSQFHTLDDIKNTRIGIQNSSASITQIADIEKKYGGFSNLFFFDTTDTALQALEKGEVDCVVHDLLVVNFLIKSKQKPYRIITEAIASDTYVIAFRKSDKALKTKIESILTNFAETDFIETTTKKWFGANISLIGR